MNKYSGWYNGFCIYWLYSKDMYEVVKVAGEPKLILFHLDLDGKRVNYRFGGDHIGCSSSIDYCKKMIDSYNANNET